MHPFIYVKGNGKLKEVLEMCIFILFLIKGNVEWNVEGCITSAFMSSDYF